MLLSSVTLRWAGSMRSIPVGRRLTSGLALCVLALQLALSFGHVHLDGIYRTKAGAAVTGFVAKAQPQPAPQSGDNDDYCAICASIYLATSSFVPQAPSLPVPFASQLVEHVDCATTAFVAPRRAPFQSRAPPLLLG